MSAGIRSGTTSSALQQNGADAVPFDGNGLTVDAYKDGTITAAKLASDVPFREGFTSAEQTITSAGPLTIAHGLSASPSLLQARLICKTAQHGYSIGDEVIINPGENDMAAAQDRGLMLRPDSTNINVRFGAAAAAIAIVNNTTGSSAAITNGNWRLIVRAWV